MSIIKNIQVLEFGKTYPNGIFLITSFSNLEEIKSRIESGRFMGTLPQGSTPDINLANVSHKVVKMVLNEKGMWIDIKILDTPKGRLLKSFFLTNSDWKYIFFSPWEFLCAWYKKIFGQIETEEKGFHFFPKGMGKIRNGIIENYELISIDVVIDSEENS